MILEASWPLPNKQPSLSVTTQLYAESTNESQHVTACRHTHQEIKIKARTFSFHFQNHCMMGK